MSALAAGAAARAGAEALRGGDGDTAVAWFGAGLRDAPDPGCLLGLQVALTECALRSTPALRTALAGAIRSGALDPAPWAAAIFEHAREDRDLLDALLRATVVPHPEVESLNDPGLSDALRTQARLRGTLPPRDADREVEAAIAAGLPRIGTGPESTVRAAVRDQYERWPYPRWTTVGQHRPQFVGERLARLFPHARLDPRLDRPVSILIAGCGTGRHALATAARTVHSGVLAIDLSRPSLAYAERKRRELGLETVTFAEAAIEDLGSLDQRFDVIECAGVLHHLEDPMGGWRILRSLLAPGGVMQIGLYSAAARRPVEAARRLLTDLAPTADGVREARRRLHALPPEHPAAPLTTWHDLYSDSGVVDLLFHARETSYDLLEIEAMADTLDLTLLGVDGLPGPTLARYREETPGDPTATSWDGWHRFEQRHPRTFDRMFQLWFGDQPRSCLPVCLAQSR